MSHLLKNRTIRNPRETNVVFDEVGSWNDVNLLELICVNYDLKVGLICEKGLNGWFLKIYKGEWSPSNSWQVNANYVLENLCMKLRIICFHSFCLSSGATSYFHFVSVKCEFADHHDQDQII